MGTTHLQLLYHLLRRLRVRRRHFDHGNVGRQASLSAGVIWESTRDSGFLSDVAVALRTTRDGWLVFGVVNQQ